MSLALRFRAGCRGSRLVVETLVLLTALALVRGAGAQEIAIDDNDIGGVVTGPEGPEAGVWVIAETSQLDTRFIRIVVTDEEGRYVIPDLPEASFDVWVRGYGLVDSPKLRANPGRTLDLSAVPAPDRRSAAQYYPAIYWYSMLDIPAEDQFGGSSDIPQDVTQDQWLATMKNRGCVGCHQMGNKATRTIPARFGTGEDAWRRRVQSGQAGRAMLAPLAGQLGGVPFEYFADWTTEIRGGELPHATPPRPDGVERNIVVTVRDWHSPEHYVHDPISTDRRNPTVNADGPIYGASEFSTDEVPVLEPAANEEGSFTAQAREGTGYARAFHALAEPLAPSAYWGSEATWNSRTSIHNPMFDEDGRVWFTARIRNEENPEFCRQGSDHPSARLTPVNESTRQLSVYDPETQEYTMIDTCFTTHHLQFDENGILWTSGGGPVAGWLDAGEFLNDGDAAAAQGWTALILDTNGNGRRDEDYVAPDAPVDPEKDKRVIASLYAVMPSPADDSVWGTSGVFGGTGKVVRIVPGDNPPQTTLTEVFNVPAPGFAPRGGDIDKEGVVWVSLGSGHLASFDRRKCEGPLRGPEATGDHCPEGWEFHQYPGPGFEGLGENSAESSYYTWVDQHNTFGLGEDVPVSTGNLNDGLIAFDDGNMVTLRVPYPMGFYAKGLDGRIDDREAGWKGRGLWSASGDRAPWHIEGGKGTRPLVVHFQLRPDPLAK